MTLNICSLIKMYIDYNYHAIIISLNSKIINYIPPSLSEGSVPKGWLHCHAI